VSIFVSDIGSPIAMAVLAAIGGLVFLVRHRWLMLWAWVAAFGGGVLLDTVLKDIVQRPRPAGASEYLVRMSYSFPSGHAMGSLIGYGMLAYVLVVLWWRGSTMRVVTVAIGVVIVLLVGLSRLYLGVHYFSDVAGGYVAGVIWLTACISSVEVLRRKPASPVRPLPRGGAED
jgi:undecaprenyl-diphosphatase